MIAICLWMLMTLQLKVKGCAARKRWNSKRLKHSLIQRHQFTGKYSECCTSKEKIGAPPWPLLRKNRKKSADTFVIFVKPSTTRLPPSLPHQSFSSLITAEFSTRNRRHTLTFSRCQNHRSNRETHTEPLDHLSVCLCVHVTHRHVSLCIWVCISVLTRRLWVCCTALCVCVDRPLTYNDDHKQNDMISNLL